MLKPSTNLEFEIIREDRKYILTFPNNSPLGELHDVIFQMRNFVVQKINESIKADKPKTVEETSE